MWSNAGSETPGCAKLLVDVGDAGCTKSMASVVAPERACPRGGDIGPNSTLSSIILRRCMWDLSAICNVLLLLSCLMTLPAYPVDTRASAPLLAGWVRARVHGFFHFKIDG